MGIGDWGLGYIFNPDSCTKRLKSKNKKQKYKIKSKKTKGEARWKKKRAMRRESTHLYFMQSTESTWCLTATD